MKCTVFTILLVLCIALLIARKHLSPNVNISANVLTILEQRHSGNSFDTNKLVTNDQIKIMIRAAQLAPSSYNEQPWNFIICDKKIDTDAYNKAFSTLVEFNQHWAKNAQLLIIITASLNSRKKNGPNLWAQYDTGAAAFSMAIQANALGLITHQMGGFNATEVSKLFQLPKDVVPLSIMAIGYEDLDHSNPKLRKRKSINENFFQGYWGAANDSWAD